MIVALFFLFNGISTFMDYLKPNPSFVEVVVLINPKLKGDKGVPIFPKGMSPKLNVIA